MDQQLAIIDAQPIAEAITLDHARHSYEALGRIVREILVPNQDYGILPGMTEPYLKKTGAEKLVTRFRLRADPSCQQSKEDWEKGIFFYRYRCTLYYGQEAVGACEGSCTNLEDKFRYRWVERPKPDKETQARMKQAKTGRNRRFGEDWVWQEREEVANPYDAVNSVLKRAQKRAMVGAVLAVFAATGFFAGQGEEFLEDEDEDPRMETPQSRPAASSAARNAPKEAPANGPTQFWLKARQTGIKTEDAKPIADRAASGKITWEQAIAELPHH